MLLWRKQEHRAGRPVNSQARMPCVTPSRRCLRPTTADSILLWLMNRDFSNDSFVAAMLLVCIAALPARAVTEAPLPVQEVVQRAVTRAQQMESKSGEHAFTYTKA